MALRLSVRPDSGHRSWLRRGARRRLLVLMLGTVALLSIGSAAWAYFSSSGTGAATVSTATLNPPTNLTAHGTTGGAGVSLAWTGSVLSSGQPAQGYYATRVKNSDGSMAAACGTSATAATTSTSCTDSNVADGSYHYIVTAVYHSWTATSAASNSVTVSVASKLVFTGQPSNTVAGVSISPAVSLTVEDSLGNPVAVSGTQVTVAIGTNPANGTLSGTLTSATNSSGVVTFADLSINRAGSGYTLSATSGSLTGATSGSFTISAAAASKLAFGQQPSTTAAGSPISPAVTVQIVDQYGNLTTSTANVTVAIGANPSSGTVTGTLTQAATAGTASFGDLSINKAGTGYTLTAASSGMTGSTSAGFTITAAAASKFSITSPPITGQASATATLGPITVQEQDTFGNPATAPAGGTTVSLSSNSTGTAIFAATAGGSSTSSITIPAGSSSATFYYGDTKAGSPVITASGTLSSAAQAETIAPAAATKLAFGQQPSTTAAGSAMSPAVTVRILDQYGNLTTSTATVTVAIGTNPSSGTLTGTLTQAATAGTATFGDLSINKAGTGYTLTAASSGLTGSTSAGFTITASAPATITVNSGSPQATGTGTAFGSPLVARVTDAYGNVVPGATVTFTAPATGASGTFANATRSTTTATNASGLATASTFTANSTAGSYAVSASAAGTGSVSFTLANTSASLTLTPTAGHTGSTVTVSGSGWTHSSTLTATFNGTAVTLTSATTASNGQIATGCSFTVPNLPAGTYQVVVRDAGGRVGAANFTIN